MLLPIEQKLVRYNFNPGINKPQYVVIHDTGNRGKTATALAHFNYFNGGNRGASAHYFVDKDRIIQIIKDGDSSWHIGDGGGRFGMTNRNSIGIEICINDNIPKATENSAYLAAHLLKKHGLPLSKMVRHYDTSRKNCPATMSANNWAAWHAFVKKVESIMKGTVIKEDEIDMNKDDVIKLIDSRISANNNIIEKIILEKVDRTLISSPESGDKWVESDFKELNAFLKENGIDEFTDLNHSKLAKRAVIIRMLNLVRKATLNEVAELVKENK